MNTTLIIIGLSILLLVSLLVFFLIKNLQKENFVATDGSSFKSQSDLDLYQDILVKAKPLFANDDVSSNTQTILGFDRIFLANLKTDGFTDLKTLFKYRNQFKALSKLINP